MLQDIPISLHGTIAENIAYGRADATREEILKLPIANVIFVQHLIMGMTLFLQMTVQACLMATSAIAIARAVCQCNRFFILDEATSY